MFSVRLIHIFLYPVVKLPDICIITVLAWSVAPYTPRDHAHQDPGMGVRQLDTQRPSFLALEKCVKYNQLCLTILTLRGFERTNIAHIPMLQNATIVELDYNRQEICLEAVVKHIKG